MKDVGFKSPAASLANLGIKGYTTAHWNLSPEALTEETVKREQGVLTDNGTLCINTGKFTGRSPQDRFIVKDAITTDTVDWGDINVAFDADKFDALYNKVVNYFEGKELFVRDAYACANETYRLNIRVVTEYPWSNQFAYNMFLRPTEGELQNFGPEWHVLCAPGFMADAEIDGTRQENFAILNFTKKTIIIGGTGYTGEIKKGIFSALNYLLPKNHDVMAMHCSANVSDEGDVALFFGLSGTGKTTLSSDAARKLIGDDEHGWANDGVFNFEGGCYAKTINLSKEKEPEIYKAIQPGAILENLLFEKGTKTPDFEDTTITQNTRVSYPIHHIDNIAKPSRAGHPKNVFFLTCDAFGVLPPISKLTFEQSMEYFLLGYTAKVAGTEVGITEPKAVFSACFGAPFLPLHPTAYADLLKQKIEEHGANTWLINTGWSGGGFGVGSRIKLKYTRAMIHAALDGKLNDVKYATHEVFGLNMPTECPNVPADLLNPAQTWADKAAYAEAANNLLGLFETNKKKYLVADPA